MFMPELSADQYLALGKFAYQFCNLERWVNWGVIEAEDIADQSQQAGLPDKPFQRRLNRMELAFCRCEKRDMMTLGKNPPDFDFTHAADLGQRRNSLMHGEPLTLVDFHVETTTEPTSVNFDRSHERGITLDIETLHAMADEAHQLAERLMVIVLNLGCKKKHMGLTSRILA